MSDLVRFLLKRIEAAEWGAKSNTRLRAGLDVETRTKGSHTEYRIGDSRNAWRQLTPLVRAQISESLPPDPAVMDDCAAKRLIVEFVSRVQDSSAAHAPGAWGREEAGALTQVLRLLAAPYWRDPDYDQAWRP